MNSVKQSGGGVRESTESLMRCEGRCRAAISCVRPEIEGGYELNNRPAWLKISIQGALHLMKKHS